jgi:acetyl-CoA C-acetyltransferase
MRHLDFITFIAGAAQASFHGDTCDHPAKLMASMAQAALKDAGIDDIAGEVDGIACVEPLSWNYQNLTMEVARELGCREDVREFWVPAGGTSPQDLLHQMGIAVAAGEIDCAVIAGGEAMRARRRAIRENRELDWPERDKDVNPMRGQGPFSSALEQRHGLRMPIQTFPLYENAICAANGRSAHAQIELAAMLLAKNARVAADNPSAWFHDAPSAEDIATVTPDNRLIAYPYTKRMNAIMDVNQAAAIVLVSGRFAKTHELTGRSAAVLGGCGAEDPWFPTERRTFSESPAMNLAVRTALNRAGLGPGDIDAMDLYSCFPSAIQLGLIAAGVGVDDARPFSLTGGLAFAGGPGNAYVVHSLASAVMRLRKHSEMKLLVTGIGMANTKQAATVLSAGSHIPAGATGEMTYREETGETPVSVREEASGTAKIVTYTIEYNREGIAINVIFMLELAEGARTIANAEDPVAMASNLLEQQPVGRTGTVQFDVTVARNLFSLDDC